MKSYVRTVLSTTAGQRIVIQPSIRYDEITISFNDADKEESAKSLLLNKQELFEFIDRVQDMMEWNKYE